MATYAFCSGCGCIEPVDTHWRALWIDSDEGSALVITERYLHGVPLDGAYELYLVLAHPLAHA